MIFSKNIKRKITILLFAVTLASTTPAEASLPTKIEVRDGTALIAMGGVMVALCVCALVLDHIDQHSAARERARRYNEELEMQSQLQRALEEQRRMQEAQQNSAQQPGAIEAPAIPKVTFADVIGGQDAKAALSDIVEFLRDPQAYAQLGARLPKGILLEGEPGNGKTLLAKALAGEAGASFIAITGADFTDRYVGVGVQRVQELFAKARQHTPCIIFIDEIDGIGKRSGDDHSVAIENNRIIGKLLTEMDGLETDPTKPVIVVGATNHRENVDKALLRSGRCDTIVHVENPLLADRKAILELYAQKLRADIIDFNTLATKTNGFSGADLANLVNQAALFAAREKATSVQNIHFEQALEQMSKTRGPKNQPEPRPDFNKFLEKIFNTNPAA